MKKIIVLILSLFLIRNTAFAQKNSWTIGFDFGAIGTVWQKGNATDIYKNNGFYFPLFYELTLSYGFTNYLSITTGIAWNVYNKAGFKGVKAPYGLTLNETFSNAQYFLYEYSSIDIPIKLNFFIPLGKSRFYFTGSAGLIIEIVEADDPMYPPRPVPDNGAWMQSDSWVFGKLYGLDNEYAVFRSLHGIMYHKKVNFLINAGIGFGYRFKCGVGLSLMGDYHIGMRVMGEYNLKYRLTYSNDYYTPLKEYVDKLYFRGDYWKVALGISYTFKQKKKE
ncbi:MAG: hypothetical protein LBU51_08425 [Bacteroidales bacterium]|jgi:hypothetical protein|nr:hypothetical protein [Bacteroidales bacterium]